MAIGKGRTTGGIGKPARKGSVGKMSGFVGDSLSPGISNTRFSRVGYPTTTSTATTSTQSTTSSQSTTSTATT